MADHDVRGEQEPFETRSVLSNGEEDDEDWDDDDWDEDEDWDEEEDEDEDWDEEEDWEEEWDEWDDDEEFRRPPRGEEDD